MMSTYSKNTNKGFTLFFAIIVISIVLSIGISLSLIALKETSLAAIRRESQLAYYASESGTSCALYWILNEFRTNATPSSIGMTCNGAPLQSVGNSGTYVFDYAGAGEVPPFPYESEVRLTGGGSTWEIESEGRNRTGNVAIKTQRSQRTRVSPGTVGQANDIIFAIDHSGSICQALWPDNNAFVGDETTPDGLVGVPRSIFAYNDGHYRYELERRNCNQHKAMRSSALWLLDNLNPDPTNVTNGNRVGIITFAGVGQLNGSHSAAKVAEQYYYAPTFGQPKIQTHLDAAEITSKNTIEQDASNFLQISYGDGTNITDTIELAICEFTGKKLNAASYTSPCTTNDIDGTGSTHDRLNNGPLYDNPPVDINYPDSLIIFTDGGQNVLKEGSNRRFLLNNQVQNECDTSWQQLVDKAAEAKALGIKIYVVAVGDVINDYGCWDSRDNGRQLQASLNDDYGNRIIKDIFKTEIASPETVDADGKTKKYFYFVSEYCEQNPTVPSDCKDDQLRNTFSEIVKTSGLVITVLE
ncbi:hypothetical protein KW782_00630 [Candidatus Parcubacteria bacterium]|nr:hypothetical protein [Candidatus Parcubacteria bacterium]